MNLKDRKILVVDTSVLLYDKNCIFNFKGNDVYIPLIVLEELDKFKSREGILGENARHVNRLLDNIRKSYSLSEGHYIEEKDVFVKVWNDIDENNSFFKINKNNNDNIILSTAMNIIKSNEDRKIVLISKDINLRVKSDAIGIKANDYYADYEFIKDDFYKGYRNINCESHLIDALYSNSSISLEKILSKKCVINENEFVVIKNEASNKSALCIKKDKREIVFCILHVLFMISRKKEAHVIIYMYVCFSTKITLRRIIEMRKHAN